jgi:peptidoglycan/xylan/chitin deacetylase (PgdA/CDA1 family)
VKGRGGPAKSVLAGVLLLSLNVGGLMAAGTPSWIDAARPDGPDTRLVYHVPILMYHRIAPDRESRESIRELVVAPEVLSAQLGALHGAGWRTITLRDLAGHMQSGTPAPAKTFVLTIDDGWADGYTYALPILRRLGYVATYFVISDRIGTSSMLSAAQLRELEAAGNEIGNHTKTHPDLRYETPARVRREIEEGSDGIARAIGHRPASFSYPRGGVDLWMLPLVAETADLQVAVTTREGPETWATRYRMPRMAVNEATTPGRLLEDVIGYR